MPRWRESADVQQRSKRLPVSTPTAASSSQDQSKTCRPSEERAARRRPPRRGCRDGLDRMCSPASSDRGTWCHAADSHVDSYADIYRLAHHSPDGDTDNASNTIGHAHPDSFSYASSLLSLHDRRTAIPVISRRHRRDHRPTGGYQRLHALSDRLSQSGSIAPALGQGRPALDHHGNHAGTTR